MAFELVSIDCEYNNIVAHRTEVILKRTPCRICCQMRSGVALSTTSSFVSYNQLPNAQNICFVDQATLSDSVANFIARAENAHRDMMFGNGNEPGPERQICTCSSKNRKQYYPRVFRSETSLYIRNQGPKLAESCKKEVVL